MHDGTDEQRRIQDALDRLDTHVGSPGTEAFHDPLYLALDEGLDAHRTTLAEALRSWPSHPLAARIEDLVGPALRRSLPQLLGVSEHADLVVEVERRLARDAEVREILQARIDALERHNRQLLRGSNMLAAAGALIAIFALLGWLIALGGWHIDWMEAPSPPYPADTPVETP